MTLESKKAEYLETISRIERKLQTIIKQNPEFVNLHNENLQEWKDKLDKLSQDLPDLNRILTNKLEKYEKLIAEAIGQILGNNFSSKSSPVYNAKNFAFPEIKPIEIEVQAASSLAAPSTSYFGNVLSYFNPFHWFGSSTPAPQLTIQATSSSVPAPQAASQPPKTDVDSAPPTKEWSLVAPKKRGMRLWTGEEAKREAERKNQDKSQIR